MRPLNGIPSTTYQSANPSPVILLPVQPVIQPLTLQPEPRTKPAFPETWQENPILAQFDQYTISRVHVGYDPGVPGADHSVTQSYSLPSLEPLNPPHLIVEALAGTGKTFTIMEACFRMCGIRRPGIVGSEEQEAIWSAMTETYDPHSIYMVAFNKNIADVLKSQVPPNVSASTAHGFGKRILGFHKIGTGKFGVYQKKANKTFAILRKKFNLEDNKQLFAKHKPDKLFAIAQIVSLCKLNLVTIPTDLTTAYTLIEDMLITHGITLPEWKNPDDKDFVFLNAIDVYNCNHEHTKVIDFDDMVWMPWRLNLRCKPYEVMFVDERQDLNLAQQELVVTNSKRLIMVGDSNQAIYGFAGADVSASTRMEDRLSLTTRGIKTFPLTYTRRCSKAVVRFNQKINPNFKYFDTNAEGNVFRETEETFLPKVRLGDMIVCRTNAPLFGYALWFMKCGIPFRTTIKQFFEDIIDLIESFDCANIPELLEHLERWKERQLAKCTGAKQDYSVIIEDQVIAIQYACSQVPNVKALISLLESVFKISKADRAGDGPDRPAGKLVPDPTWVFLSSIHQAKGLEAPRVWWPRHDQVPHPKAKLIEQEINLRWVAGTRAIDDLVLVDSIQPRRTLEQEMDYDE